MISEEHVPSLHFGCPDGPAFRTLYFCHARLFQFRKRDFHFLTRKATIPCFSLALCFTHFMTHRVLLPGLLLLRWRGCGFGEMLHRWITAQIIHPQEFPEVLSLTGGVV